MSTHNKKSKEGLLGGRAERPDLKELTIAMGRSDLYVNLEKHVALEDGHTLFEAILTDDQGSKVIFVDQEDIAECLRDSIILGGAKPAGEAEEA